MHSTYENTYVFLLFFWLKKCVALTVRDLVQNHIFHGTCQEVKPLVDVSLLTPFILNKRRK